MKALTGVLLIAGCLCLRAQAGESAWGTDLTNALQQAHEKQRPVLMQFTAPWCPYCRMMEGKVFTNAAVEEALDQFERVAVNIDRNAELAASHGVRGIPAFVILDADGQEVNKTSGFMEAEPFDKWLLEGVTNLTISTARKQEFEQRSKEVNAALGSTDPAVREKGVALALDFCDQKEKFYRAFGEEKLKALARDEPELLLEGLRHPGLMGRIRAANLLRGRLGGEFNIDPWEKYDAREKAVREWKTRLAAKPEKEK